MKVSENIQDLQYWISEWEQQNCSHKELAVACARCTPVVIAQLQRVAEALAEYMSDCAGVVRDKEWYIDEYTGIKDGNKAE